MRRTALLLAVAWLLPAAMSSAQKADPIREAIDKARAEHAKKVEKAKAKLGKAIEARVKAAADKSDLAGLKRLEAQKADYERDGSLPTDPLLAVDKVTHDREVRAALDGLIKALEKAKTDYTKARNVAKAEEVAEEVQFITPKRAPKPVKEAPPHDAISGHWDFAIGQIGQRQFDNEKVQRMNVRLDDGGGGQVQGRRGVADLSWRKAGPDGYKISLPNGATATVRLGPKGESFRGKMTNGAPVQGTRK